MYIVAKHYMVFANQENSYDSLLQKMMSNTDEILHLPLGQGILVYWEVTQRGRTALPGNTAPLEDL